MNKHTVAPLCVGAAFLTLLAVLVTGAARFFSDDREAVVQTLSAVTAVQSGKNAQVLLPYCFSGLAAHTAVTVTVDATPKDGDYIYIKSVYAPLKVYENNRLIYEYGQPGTYPVWMQDPATGVEFVRLPRTGTAVCLRLEYLSPAARNELTVYPVLMGSQSAIFRRLFQELGFSFLFAVLLISSGFLMLLIAAIVLSFEREGVAFLWLGLFAISVGGWAFGECNLTGLFIKNPTLLYLAAFTGLFALPFPLICFGLTVVNFHNKKPLTLLALVTGCAASTALLLQLLGHVELSKSMYLFHVLEPAALCIFAGDILYEILRYRNPSARRFLSPMTVLAVFAILEVINYRAHFTYVMSLFFQTGVLIFVLMTGVVGGMYVRDDLRMRGEAQRMKFEMELMEYRVGEQEKRQQLLLKNQKAVREQRHDLRHQLAVIRSFSEHADNVKLTEYLDSLTSAIPTEQGRSYCENEAVNAIVSHYAAEAEQNGIELSIRLAIPKCIGQISDGNLCVIVGNLFENAIEACNRMTDGPKFIRLRSRVQYGTLTIAMDNSFDGKISMRDGKFLSSKRNEVGTGLQSVLTVAEKAGGSANFESNENVFLSSVYVRL